jgi:hypothetical protein
MPLPKNYNLCNVEGCKNLFFAKNLCDKHYRRLVKYGDVNIELKTKAKFCAIENCDEKHHCKGMCKKHYSETLEYRFNRLKNWCFKRNIELDLTLSFYIDLVKDKNCFYCNSPQGMTSGSFLDRKLPKIGYIKTNVVPCCGECNDFKSDKISCEEMVEIVKILKLLRGGGLWGKISNPL